MDGRGRKKRMVDLPTGVNSHGLKFVAAISVNGKRVYLGVYSTPEEAHEAYLKAKKEFRNEL